MANPNPKTEQLALGRGTRPKLDHETVAMRMSPTTKFTLEEIARRYNCLYGGKPRIAGLLERIANGDLVVVPRPHYDVDEVTGQSGFEHNQVLGKTIEKKYNPQK